MSGWEVVGVFVGIPLLVLFVIALPIFGPVWWTALRARNGRRVVAVDREDSASEATPSTRPGRRTDPDPEPGSGDQE